MSKSFSNIAHVLVFQLIFMFIRVSREKKLNKKNENKTRCNDYLFMLDSVTTIINKRFNYAKEFGSITLF